MATILLIDDEVSIRRTLKEILAFEKYEVLEAPDGFVALEIFKKSAIDVVLLDIKMPKMDGLEVLDFLQEINPEIPVIMISGHGTIDTAVEAVKKGAYDYISKPPDLNRLLITLRNAQERHSLVTETKSLKRKISRAGLQEIIGDCPQIMAVKETIQQIAPSEARVLITGPNGSGKELVAKWIHEGSQRNNAALVEVNCAAIPSELIESELFGHEKGSFTSAHKQKLGKFEQANGGTLFLDEIGDMSLSAQAKVLRVLQEHTLTRVGGEKDIKVDVRVIAATNKDLPEEIAAGRFREDLYHRLAVIVLPVPGLCERREDIPSLIDHFIKIICREYGIPCKKIDKDAVKSLSNLPWTGNIRELRNVVERLIILSQQKITQNEVDKYVVPVSFTKIRSQSWLNSFASAEEAHRYIDKHFQWNIKEYSA
ncbi:MAG: sigma-54-dependent Fis family transcriptional regulator [Bacteroidetes bacterium]|nr:sigma-54-dependent Fis family transcriptional regulator [Bacteroidota bacterium]